MSLFKKVKIMRKTIKKEELVNSSNQPHGIKTPTSVEEFRNNLKKYFVYFGDKVYLQNGESPEISKINSLTDLYDYSKGTPMVTVKVNLLKDLKEFLVETNQLRSFYGYFEDENNFEIIDNQNDYIQNYNPVWIGIDNKLYREFFCLTLGKFSGYFTINQ